jgi:hypothetical protein
MLGLPPLTAGKMHFFDARAGVQVYCEGGTESEGERANAGGRRERIGFR